MCPNCGNEEFLTIGKTGQDPELMKCSKCRKRVKPRLIKPVGPKNREVKELSVGPIYLILAGSILLTFVIVIL